MLFTHATTQLVWFCGAVVCASVYSMGSYHREGCCVCTKYIFVFSRSRRSSSFASRTSMWAIWAVLRNKIIKINDAAGTMTLELRRPKLFPGIVFSLRWPIREEYLVPRSTSHVPFANFLPETRRHALEPPFAHTTTKSKKLLPKFFSHQKKEN